MAVAKNIFFYNADVHMEKMAHTHRFSEFSWRDTIESHCQLSETCGDGVIYVKKIAFMCATVQISLNIVRY